MTIRHLDRLLEPASVAVFGASDRPGRVGTTVWANLHGRFRGTLHAVNPRHACLGGVPAFASAKDLPSAPDLAVLCTPPPTIPPLVAELAALGTRAAALIRIPSHHPNPRCTRRAATRDSPRIGVRKQLFSRVSDTAVLSTIYRRASPVHESARHA